MLRAVLILLTALAVLHMQRVVGSRHEGAEVSGRLYSRVALADAPVYVRIFKHDTDQNSRPIPLTLRELSGADGRRYEQQTEAVPDERGHAYSFTGLKRASHYTVLSFQDLSGDGELSFSEFEPVGWTMDPDGCIGREAGLNVCTSPVFTGGGGAAVADPIELRANRRVPRRRTVRQGSLEVDGQGMTVVRLHGTKEEQSRAHGELLAEQIVDMFNHFLIEDRARSHRAYEEHVRPGLALIQKPSSLFWKEISALLRGMRASGADLMTVLGREIDEVDILALNSYGDISIAAEASLAQQHHPHRVHHVGRPHGGSCTQFAFWGNNTAGEGSISGRNMDGEIDFRRTTVTHFIVFAVADSRPGARAYVHAMWPGFIGVSSAVNAAGVHVMENAGCAPYGIPEEPLPVFREVLRDMAAFGDASIDPARAETLMKPFKSKAGGVCVSGCIMFIARPDRNAGNNAFVYEGDRYGGVFRMPGEVRPSNTQSIMASNHYFKRNMDGSGAWPVQRCNGHDVAFSSAWRYEAGMYKAEAYMNAHQKIRLAEMEELLRTVTHGTTEHSVVVQGNKKVVRFAVADPDSTGWDAPYRSWSSYSLEDLLGSIAKSSESIV